MHIMSTNVAKTLVWKHEFYVKLWCYKQCTPNTNDHHMPLNEPPTKIFCVRHWLRVRAHYLKIFWKIFLWNMRVTAFSNF